MAGELAPNTAATRQTGVTMPFIGLDAVALPVAQPDIGTDDITRPDFMRNQPAGIVVGEHNFACGPSQENAACALADYGIRAVIAPSFGDTFRTTCIKYGMLPVVLRATTVASLLNQLQTWPGARVKVDLPSQTVLLPDGSFHCFSIDPLAKRSLLDGRDAS
jgi:3-isopropylmalate/(R)-2-methylmalate dehydratase small subunit